MALVNYKITKHVEETCLHTKREVNYLYNKIGINFSFLNRLF